MNNQAIIQSETATVQELFGMDSPAGIEFTDVGWDSRVYHIRDTNYYFKFPRSDKIKRRYAQEIQALEMAANNSSDIIIPRVLFKHPQNAYFGYEGISGSPLNSVISSLKSSQKQDIGLKIGNFLRVFHSSTLTGARKIDPKDEIKQLQKWYEDGRSQAEQFFNGHELRLLNDRVYSVWPDSLEKSVAEFALCHGDLHLPNIYLGKNGTLGIIDFGDVAYYDKSKDFIDLGDDSVFESALVAYGDSEKMRQKIRLRQEFIRVITLTYHVRKGNHNESLQTASLIKRSLANH